MARKHHKPDEIVAKLRQVDVLVGQDKPVADAARTIGVMEATYYRWRSEFGQSTEDGRRRGGADFGHHGPGQAVWTIRLLPDHGAAPG